MIKLGSLALCGGPRVAVSFSDADLPNGLAEARAAGVDIAEVRLDHFADQGADHALAVLPGFAGLPTLVTLRHPDEGGAWRGSESERQAVIRAVAPLADGVDVELAFPETLAVARAATARHGKLLVASHHDFSGTPSLDTLRGVVAAGAGAGADVVKIAAHVAGDADVRTLARLLTDEAGVPLIVIGMGPEGLKTRVLFPALGSLLTFAANGDRASAPGQAPYGEMIPLLRRLYPTYRP